MYTTEGSKLKAIEFQIAEQQKLAWAMLVAGLAIGFVGLHFMVARPLGLELQKMKQDLAVVESRMQLLVGTGDEVWEANTLLSSLRSQKNQLVDARTALQSVRRCEPTFWRKPPGSKNPAPPSPGSNGSRAA